MLTIDFVGITKPFFPCSFHPSISQEFQTTLTKVDAETLSLGKMDVNQLVHHSTNQSTDHQSIQ